MGSTRAAVYTRLSRETAESTSIERQRTDTEAMVEDRGWSYSPAHYYSDVDRSGYDRAVVREGFDKLRANLDTYDVVVYWKGDRIFRDLLEFATFLGDCRNADVRPVSVKEGEIDLADPMSILSKGMFPGAQAQQESKNTSERVRSAVEYRRDNGYWHGGLIPFGYSKHRTEDGTKLVRNDDQAAIIEEVAGRVLDGESVWGIVRDLNERGVESSGRTDTWSVQAMLHLLNNPVLAGHQSYKDDDGERRIVYQDGSPVMLVLGQPVLDGQTWERVVAELDRRSGTKPASSKTLLSGLITCGECGSPMAGNRSANHYTCKTKWDKGADLCPGNQVSMNLMDEFMEGVAEGIIVDVLERGATEQANETADTAPLHERLRNLEGLERQLEEGLDKLLFDEGRGMDDPAVKRQKERMGKARQQRDEVQAEIDRINQGAHIIELRELLGTDDPVGKFEGFDTDRKRRTLTLLLDRIDVHKAERTGVFDEERIEPVPRTS